MVDAVWLVFATRAARILAKDLDQAGELCGRDHLLQRLWKVNIELLPRRILNPAAGRIRVAIRTLAFILCGKVTVNVVPCPSTLLKEMVP